MNTRINSDIKASRVLLIGEDGNKLGIFLIGDALDRARNLDLDLIQVGEDKEIPVCKIVDYSKLQSDLKKKEYEAKKKQKNQKQNKVIVKEIRLGPNTEDNDVNVRIKAANKFLSKGNHVRFTIKIKGRAMAHKDLVLDKLNTMLEEVNGTIESPPSIMGNVCSALVVPKQ